MAPAADTHTRLSSDNRLAIPVIIYFLEAEPPERDYFAQRLAGHSVTFASRLEEVGADVEILSIFINSRVTLEFLDGHPRLRLIATRSSGTDHLPMDALRERKVAVAAVGSYGERTVAEHTFALLLALSRRLREVMNKPKTVRFSYESTRGFDLQGKTMGIIGMGHIGQSVAELAHAFRMKVLAYDVERPAGLERSLDFSFVPLPELLAESHIVSLHAPLTAATYHILNRETLAQCRRGVLVINTARGALVDSQALREALDSGQVGGAGLDVLQDERVLRDPVSHIIAGDIVRHLRSDAQAYEARDADRVRELQELLLGDALLARLNVVFTPHVAFNSVETFEMLQTVTADTILAFAEGRLINAV